MPSVAFFNKMIASIQSMIEHPDNGDYLPFIINTLQQISTMMSETSDFNEEFIYKFQQHFFDPENPFIDPECKHKDYTSAFGVLLSYRVGCEFLSKFDPPALDDIFRGKDLNELTFERFSQGEAVLASMLSHFIGRQLFMKLSLNMRDHLLLHADMNAISHLDDDEQATVLWRLLESHDGLTLLRDQSTYVLQKIFHRADMNVTQSHGYSVGKTILWFLLDDPEAYTILSDFDLTVLSDIFCRSNFDAAPELGFFSGVTALWLLISTPSLRSLIPSLNAKAISHILCHHDLNARAKVGSTAIEIFISSTEGSTVLKRHPYVLIHPEKHLYYNLGLAADAELMKFLAIIGADIDGSDMSQDDKNTVKKYKTDFWKLFDKEMAAIMEFRVGEYVCDDILTLFSYHNIFDMAYPELGFLKTQVAKLYELRNQGLDLNHPLHVLAILSVSKYKEYNAYLSVDEIVIYQAVVRRCLQSHPDINIQLITGHLMLRQQLVMAIGDCNPLNPRTVKVAVDGVMSEFNKQYPFVRLGVGHPLGGVLAVANSAENQVMLRDSRVRFFSRQFVDSSSLEFSATNDGNVTQHSGTSLDTAFKKSM